MMSQAAPAVGTCLRRSDPRWDTLHVRLEPAEKSLQEHVRQWPMWTLAWNGLSCSEDPWGDPLVSSGRHRDRVRIEGWP
jgi:hypothetical protein